MLKLYKFTENDKQYWETWENNGVHTLHWGTLGTKGQSKEIKSTLFKKAETLIQAQINDLIAQGYSEIEEQYTLMVEFVVDRFGSEADLDKRHKLEGRLSETLGWTGLGHCDGGSIGSGTMEVCCFVVDFDIAKSIIEADLKGTEFDDFSRIYDENQ